jgi:hypothetical protein
MKPTVFISHVHSEADIAIWLKETISKLLLGGINFFVSSDRVAILGGDRWLNKIEDALRDAPIVLVLCSDQSVHRPWINFEAGGAWIAGKRVIPICHSGMIPTELPEPLKSLQAYSLTNHQNLMDLTKILAELAGLDVPEINAENLINSIPLLTDTDNAPQATHKEETRANNAALPAAIEINYKKDYISERLHRYSLTASVTLNQTPDQDFFRIAFLWPALFKISETHNLQEGEDVEKDGIRYKEYSMEINQRLWPEQTVKVLGENGIGKLVYEFDDEAFQITDSKNPLLYFILYLQSWMPVKVNIPFSELNFY